MKTRVQNACISFLSVALFACGSEQANDTSSLNSLGQINIDSGFQRNFVSPTSGGITLARKQTAEHFVLNVCLDQNSFLQRGYSSSDIGAWPNQKSGLLASMYYAINAGHAETQGPGTPWWEPSLSSDYYGVSAHFEYWAEVLIGSNANVYFYAYESNNGPQTCDVNLVARNTGEAPFTGPSNCGGANVIGCYAGGKEIYVNTSYSYALGLNSGQVPPKGKINMTKVIAHEFGHYLGFDHFEGDAANIMYPSLGSAPQKWDASQSQRFIEINR